MGEGRGWGGRGKVDSGGVGRVIGRGETKVVSVCLERALWLRRGPSNN